MPRRPSSTRQALAFKFRAPPIRQRGPRYLQAVTAQPKETANIPRPESYIGTRVDGPSLRQVLANINEPEWRIFWSLISLGLMPDEPDGFEYQAAVGHGHALGGNAPDFLLPGLDLALDVQGQAFHYVSTAKIGADVLIAIQLATRGIRLIAIDEADAMERPRAVTAAALRYEDWSQAARGQV